MARGEMKYAIRDKSEEQTNLRKIMNERTWNSKTKQERGIAIGRDTIANEEVLRHNTLRGLCCLFYLGVEFFLQFPLKLAP